MKHYFSIIIVLSVDSGMFNEAGSPVTAVSIVYNINYSCIPFTVCNVIHECYMQHHNKFTLGHTIKGAVKT